MKITAMILLAIISTMSLSAQNQGKEPLLISPAEFVVSPPVTPLRTSITVAADGSALILGDTLKAVSPDGVLLWEKAFREEAPNSTYVASQRDGEILVVLVNETEEPTADEDGGGGIEGGGSFEVERSALVQVLCIDAREGEERWRFARKTLAIHTEQGPENSWYLHFKESGKDRLVRLDVSGRLLWEIIL